MSEDLGFSYRIAKDGQVFISRDGRVVTTLRGGAADKFRARVGKMNPAQAQQLMARVTGNYKRS